MGEVIDFMTELFVRRGEVVSPEREAELLAMNQKSLKKGKQVFQPAEVEPTLIETFRPHAIQLPEDDLLGEVVEEEIPLPTGPYTVIDDNYWNKGPA